MNIFQPSWIYILGCNDGSYYIGVTTNVNRRLRQHNHQSLFSRHYTASRQPCTLLYTEEFDNYRVACKRERQLKKLDHNQKTDLIATNPLHETS